MALTAQAAARKDSNSPLDVRLEYRHFAFIAATLANMKPTKHDSTFELRMAEWRGACCSFTDACERTNRNFDRTRFLRACNY
jgi:hypothetical protein